MARKNGRVSAAGHCFAHQLITSCWAFFILSGISGIFSYSPIVSIGKMRAASLFTIVYLLAQNVQVVKTGAIACTHANRLVHGQRVTNCRTARAWQGCKGAGVAQASPLTKAVFRTRTVHQPTPIVNGDTDLGS
jgi:hypothetical protein